MPTAGVVADANVLLSAAVGKAALRVITDFDIAVHVAQFNADEVAEYLPLMSAKYKLQIELVETQWKLLPLRIHPLSEYQSRLARAIDEMKHRDPEDAHALALARSLDLPLWSNDKDFQNVKVECYSTARLLKTLTAQETSRG
jgi:predicted nucleic acid-binding protein